MIEGLLYGYGKNLDYMERLCSGLDDRAAASQPAPGMNHPAWVLSHLNIYHPVLMAIVQGNEFPDPKESPFGMGSAPGEPRVAYAPLAQLLSEFREGHLKVAALIQAAGSAVFQKAVPLPRWQATMPTAEKALPYLMLVHENQHLGQLSAWRRAAGLPSV